MKFDVKSRYDMLLAPFYYQLQHHMLKHKKRAVQLADLKMGDHILISCCGSGMEFSFIQERISDSGKIVGIDFSQAMLDRAQKVANDYQWKNVALLREDATSFRLDEQFDAGFCTLGLSVIDDWRAAYANFCAHIKPGGKIIIADTKLNSDSFLPNLVSIPIAYFFGSSLQKNRNMSELLEVMKEELTEFRIERYYHDTFFIAMGAKNLSR